MMNSCFDLFYKLFLLFNFHIFCNGQVTTIASNYPQTLITTSPSTSTEPVLINIPPATELPVTVGTTEIPSLTTILDNELRKRLLKKNETLYSQAQSPNPYLLGQGQPSPILPPYNPLLINPEIQEINRRRQLALLQQQQQQRQQGNLLNPFNLFNNLYPNRNLNNQNNLANNQFPNQRQNPGILGLGFPGLGNGIFGQPLTTPPSVKLTTAEPDNSNNNENTDENNGGEENGGDEGGGGNEGENNGNQQDPSQDPDIQQFQNLRSSNFPADLFPPGILSEQDLKDIQKSIEEQEKRDAARKKQQEEEEAANNADQGEGEDNGANEENSGNDDTNNNNNQNEGTEGGEDENATPIKDNNLVNDTGALKPINNPNLQPNKTPYPDYDYENEKSQRPNLPVNLNRNLNPKQQFNQNFNPPYNTQYNNNPINDQRFNVNNRRYSKTQFDDDLEENYRRNPRPNSYPRSQERTRQQQRNLNVNSYDQNNYRNNIAFRNPEDYRRRLEPNRVSNGRDRVRNRTPSLNSGVIYEDEKNFNDNQNYNLRNLNNQILRPQTQYNRKLINNYQRNSLPSIPVYRSKQQEPITNINNLAGVEYDQPRLRNHRYEENDYRRQPAIRNSQLPLQFDRRLNLNEYQRNDPRLRSVNRYRTNRPIDLTKFQPETVAQRPPIPLQPYPFQPYQPYSNQFQPHRANQAQHRPDENESHEETDGEDENSVNIDNNHDRYQLRPINQVKPNRRPASYSQSPRYFVASASEQISTKNNKIS